MKGKSYLRLMRFHKPVGILLLWLPTAWALWIANQGHPSLELILLFLCGTVLMRAVGVLLMTLLIATSICMLNVHKGGL
ncbi:4-hydroxybenzoate-octaprenyltransferase [Legionella feeleii]|uniref:4-hydroxybenzoate-octaprenyltransferase n=1 Tax=Legionella feeleii TaxID=453 RepID=A0A2X1QQV2_9GAMM|nr:4-hydroxybenzoate-octaprenyltransferase [Legionella feeleii]